MRTLLLTAFLAAPSGLAAQQRDIAPIVDRVFSSWTAPGSPGCAVGVARGGAVLLTKGYGLADLESGRAISPETIFETGSVAKQFTATAVVLLATDGKLNLDDPVRKYVPELPDYGSPLTIRHLLTHTSGLREWSALVGVQGWPRGSRVHRQADLLDVVTRQRSLNHKPGEFYSYTNSGYGLLFTVVERVSGQPFATFTTDRIFTPLGMSNTRWRDDFTRVVPGRAQAYSREDDGWHLEMPFENVVGPGGLLTTVGDLLKWNAALTHRTPPLGAAVVDSLSRRPKLTGVGGRGRESEYALGLVFTSYRGVPEVSHGGATAAYRTFLTRYPTEGDLSIAVMCNAGNANGAAYAHQIADSLIAAFGPVALDTVPLDTVRFARLVGGYRNTRTHEPQLIRPAMAPRFRSFPDGSFYFINGRLRIYLDSASTRTMRAISEDADTVLWRYAGDGPWAPAAADKQAIAGAYRSEEVGVTFTVGFAGDTLTVSPRAGDVAKFRPAYRDGFVGQGVVWFERDARGRVTALHYSQSRVWDLKAAPLSKQQMRDR
jgi:CubicO group peptidase (beta-lactamase class C family)